MKTHLAAAAAACPTNQPIPWSNVLVIAMALVFGALCLWGFYKLLMACMAP